jgi:hypothetical protein
MVDPINLNLKAHGTFTSQTSSYLIKNGMDFLNWNFEIAKLWYGNWHR